MTAGICLVYSFIGKIQRLPAIPGFPQPKESFWRKNGSREPQVNRLGKYQT
jgi:hypothetical protein